MVNDIEPFEELFRGESEEIFQKLRDSTKQGLDVLCARLSGTSVRAHNASGDQSD